MCERSEERIFLLNFLSQKFIGVHIFSLSSKILGMARGDALPCPLWQRACVVVVVTVLYSFIIIELGELILFDRNKFEFLNGLV